MVRYVLGALIGAVVLVWNAAAQPTMEQLQASARWSVQLQTALQGMMSEIERIDEYVVIMDRAVAEELSMEESGRLISAVTADLNRGIERYVVELEALPPHPIPDEPLGKAMVDIRQQMIGQSGMFADFFGRLDSLSRKAIDGDVQAVDQLGGEVFRSGAFLLGTDIALLRTQVNALENDNPLRNLNLASIAQLQFTREIMLSEATFRFGPSPGFSDGDLDAAGAHLPAARREIANGRRNAAKLRAMLVREKTALGSTDPLYDRIIAMVDTFAGDWANMEDALTDSEVLLRMMIEGHEDTEQAFEDYLIMTSTLASQMLASQLERSRLVAN